MYPNLYLVLSLQGLSSEAREELFRLVLGASKYNETKV